MRYRELVEAKKKNPFPGKPFPGLTPGFIDYLRNLRHLCRIDNGGGGACHVISEFLENKYGWMRFSGAYLSRDGEVIDSGHLWNYLPDGSILDATADQHGEGNDIRVITPNDPDYGRYRPEWSEFYHPGMAEYNASWPHPHSTEGWTGETDWDRSIRLDRERGPNWHVTDQDQWNAYSREQWKRYGHDNWFHSRAGERPSDLGEPEFNPDEQIDWDKVSKYES